MIRAYLDASRRNYHYFEEKDSYRFSKIIEAFRHDMSTENVKVHFIQSPEAKSEYVELGGTVHIVIDRQISLYNNSIDYADFYSEAKGSSFDDELYSAFIFIAASQCFNLGYYKIARELHETYILNNYSYFYPKSIGDEAVRLSFIFYHEWGHFFAGKYKIDNIGKEIDKAFKKHQNDCIVQVRGDVERELFYSEPYYDLYIKNNKHECMADLFSSVKVLELLEEDSLFRGIVGGEAQFIHKSLISIYQFELIKYIQDLVKFALDDAPLPLDNRAYTEERNDIKIQRIRLSRQVLISILQAVKGAKVAEDTFNRFTEYLSKVDTLSTKILFPKLYKFINFLSSIDYNDDDFTDQDALEYCIKEMYWHDD